MQQRNDQIPTALAQVLDTFGQVTDEAERSNLLIDYAAKFRQVPEHIATRPFPEDHRAKYCESEAYVWALEQPDHTLRFFFAVENPSGISAKALAFILDKTLSGATPEQVANVSPNIVFDIFRKDISMGKGMGLTSIVETVRQLARQYVGQAHKN